MVCLDVGANLGQITIHMADLVRPDGRVHAFEPVPAIAHRLREHLAENDLERVAVVHEAALSDANGEFALHVAEPGELNQGMASLVNRAHPKLVREITVPTIRLDDFVRQQGLERLDWMKIDIQGAEPLLLEGAARTLAELKPDLLIEVSPGDLASLGKTSHDLLALLEQHGYKLFEVRGARAGRLVDVTTAPVDYAGNVYATRFPDGRG
jgi:FkbM family methyltransferase